MMKSGILKKYLKKLQLYKNIYKDKRTPLTPKIFLWLAIAYLLLPFDIIPDFIPVIGQLDDIIIVPALVFIALRFVPRRIYDEHYANIYGSAKRRKQKKLNYF